MRASEQLYFPGLARLREARYNPGLNSAAADADLLRRYRYLFDLGGNRTQEIATVVATTTTTDYEYNAANQTTRRRVNAGAWVNYAYDPNGNLTSDGTNSYTWDRANRMHSIGTTRYVYDGFGNRIQQNVGVTVTKYLLDLQPGLAVVLAETTGANTTRYVHALRGIHAHKDAANNWEWPLQDGLGSVRGVASIAAAVLESRNYEPFGAGFGATGTSQTPYGFTGEPTDSNGLVYLRARYYSPALGVFASRDPFEGMADRPMSLNGYSWVEGNVANATDASGMLGENPVQWDSCYSYQGESPAFSCESENEYECECTSRCTSSLPAAPSPDFPLVISTHLDSECLASCLEQKVSNRGGCKLGVFVTPVRAGMFHAGIVFTDWSGAKIYYNGRMENAEYIGTYQPNYGPLIFGTNSPEDAENSGISVGLSGLIRQANQTRHYTLDKGFDVCSVKACFDSLAIDIRSRNETYYAWGPNSNTVARLALERCGSYDVLAERILANFSRPAWENVALG